MTTSTTTRTRKTRSSRAPIAAALVLLLAAGAPAADTASAQKVIEATVVEVLAVLKDDARTAAQKRVELEKIAHGRFDFRTMARLVLGRDWKGLGPEKQDAFVDQFTTYLANDYGSRLERYHQEKVDVIGEEPKPRGDVVVKTRIVGGANDGAIVDYRMRKGDEGWRIIDVVIEGISLVANFRDQFREVMSKSGPEGLLQRLKEKNAAAEA